MAFQVSNKRLILSLILGLGTFIILFTFLSLNGFHTWLRRILFHGAHENYNMLKEIYHAYPFLGRNGRYSYYQVVSIFVVSITTSIYVMTIILKDSFSSENRYLYILSPVVILSYLVALVSMAAKDCIFGLDEILSTYVNPTVAQYVNAGPNQLAIISVLIGISIIYLVYVWMTGVNINILIERSKNRFF